MLASAYACYGILVELLVDDGSSAGLGIGTSASSYEYIDGRRLHVVCLQHVEYHVISEIQLVINVCELQ